MERAHHDFDLGVSSSHISEKRKERQGDASDQPESAREIDLCARRRGRELAERPAVQRGAPCNWREPFSAPGSA
jgi:hypothetical protein